VLLSAAPGLATLSGGALLDEMRQVSCQWLGVIVGRLTRHLPKDITKRVPTYLACCAGPCKPG